MSKATTNPDEPHQGAPHQDGPVSASHSPKSRPHDGGPAFPCPSTNAGDGGRVPQAYSGLSKRELLAGLIMGHLAAHSGKPDWGEDANCSVLAADALIKRLAK